MSTLMKPALPIRAQRGAFLLEALIGILIFSLGILGIVGLQAQAIRFTNDSEYRAEATYLANELISEMWTDQLSSLKASYESPGPKYTAFRSEVVTRMQGATIPAGTPIVKVDTADLPAAVSQTSTGQHSSVVQVEISWQLPGDTGPHNYIATGVIGVN